MKTAGYNRKILVRFLICWGTLLVSLVLFPVLAWRMLPGGWLPERLGSVLFFWPQYLFLPNGLTHESTLGQGTYLAGAASVAAAIFWFFAIAVYVLSTRRLPAAVVYAALLPAVFVVLAAVVGLLGLVGVGIVLDGP